MKIRVCASALALAIIPSLVAAQTSAPVAAAFKDPQTYSSARGITLEQVQSDEPLQPSLIWMDPPDHRQMRGLVNKVFTPRAIASLQLMVRETIERYLTRVDRNGFDVVADFSAYFPVDIITTMLGVPPDDRQQLRIWQDITLQREVGQVGASQGGAEAFMQTGMFYYNLIQQRRAEPQDDMISDLITVDVERADGTTAQLDDIEIDTSCLKVQFIGIRSSTNSNENNFSFQQSIHGLTKVTVSHITCMHIPKMRSERNPNN